MARPPLPIGAHGRIRVYRLGAKRYRARTQVRDHDGVIRHVERVGTSDAGARQLLVASLSERGRAARDGEITADSTVRKLGALWLAEIERAVNLGKRSPNTLGQYRLRYDQHVRDGLGRLRVRELTTGRLDRIVIEVHDRHGTAAAKTVRTVVSGMVGLAVRHDAMDRNPVRDVGRIESDRGSTRALALPEAIELRGKLHADKRCRALDQVDLTDFMLATGLRIGVPASAVGPARAPSAPEACRSTASPPAPGSRGARGFRRCGGDRGSGRSPTGRRPSGRRGSRSSAADGPVIPTEQAWRAGVAKGIRLSQIAIRKGV